MRTLAWLLCCSALAVVAGCGGGGKPAAQPAATTTAKACRTPAQLKALARLDADLAAMKVAANAPVKDTLKGGPAINRATDRFLLHVELAPVDNLVRNRMIDHAAALSAPVCQQCFQALEAARPIPSIAHAHNGAACHAPTG